MGYNLSPRSLNIYHSVGNAGAMSAENVNRMSLFSTSPNEQNFQISQRPITCHSSVIGA